MSLATRGFAWVCAAAFAVLLMTTLLPGAKLQRVLLDMQRARLAAIAADLRAAAGQPGADALPILPAHGDTLQTEIAFADPSGNLVGAGAAHLGMRLPAKLLTAEGQLLATRRTHLAGGNLIAVDPIMDSVGRVTGAIVVREPVTACELQGFYVVLQGLRDGLLVLLCGLPAAWLGARIALARITRPAANGEQVLDATRMADAAAETSANRPRHKPESPQPTAFPAANSDPQLAACVERARAALCGFDEAVATITQVEAEARPAA